MLDMRYIEYMVQIGRVLQAPREDISIQRPRLSSKIRFPYRKSFKKPLKEEIH